MATRKRTSTPNGFILYRGPSQYDGKPIVIVITGAAGGFGRLVAEKTAAMGARIVGSDVDGSALETAVAGIRASGGQAEGVVADVTRRDEMEGVAARAVEAFGSIDVMVNNAGVMPLAFFADHEQAASAWDRCIDINLKGV